MAYHSVSDCDWSVVITTHRSEIMFHVWVVKLYHTKGSRNILQSIDSNIPGSKKCEHEKPWTCVKHKGEAPKVEHHIPKPISCNGFIDWIWYIWWQCSCLLGIFFSLVSWNIDWDGAACNNWIRHFIIFVFF